MTGPQFELVPLATVRVTRGDVHRLGATAFHRRVIGGIAQGRWEGERINADIVAPGGDWAIPSTDGSIMLLDVRQTLRTDDGALIYFEDQRTPPSPDMLGQVVVVELDTGEVLVKRLLRGAAPGRFDLESVAGPTRRDARLRWAAHITAIVPPWQARRILIQGD